MDQAILLTTTFLAISALLIALVSLRVSTNCLEQSVREKIDILCYEIAGYRQRITIAERQATLLINSLSANSVRSLYHCSLALNSVDQVVEEVENLLNQKQFSSLKSAGNIIEKCSNGQMANAASWQNELEQMLQLLENEIQVGEDNIRRLGGKLRVGSPNSNI